MKKMFFRPQTFFILLAIVCVIVGFFKEGTVLDFNYLLAFLLIDVWSVAFISAIFFLLISVNYASLYFVGKKPKTSLTAIHIVLQLIAFLPLLYYMVTANSETSTESSSFSNIVLLISFLIFFISVIVHLINFFYSLLLKNNS